MKLNRKWFAALMLLISSTCVAQVNTVKRKIVTVLPEQGTYLNGTGRGYLGGVSRVTFKVDLPPSTVEWYYIFSTTPNEGASQNLGLVSQLTKYFDPSGATSVAANLLIAPPGSEVVDIFVMDAKGKANFLEKDMIGAWVYENPGSYEEGKSLNAKQGRHRIDDVRSGTVWLGLKNPSATSGINVNIEVAAVVDVEETNLNEWSAETKGTIFKTYYDAFVANGMEASGAKELSNCIIGKLIAEYSPADFSEMSDAEIEEIQMGYSEACVADLQGGEKTDEQKKGETYGSLGWKAFENGDLDKAIDYSKKAVAFDNTLGWVHANIGLFHLIKKDEAGAMDYYINAISYIKKDHLSAKTYFEGAIDDIKAALKKYPPLSGHKEILQQLQEEYAKY